MPVACQQCRNAPCTKVCPTGATWTEKDGIVVVDYDWCIGCRYCMAACPYGARHFNWAEPGLPKAEINPKTHVLGNRPRRAGVVEKCTFCIQRVAQRPLPGLRRGLPDGVAEVREPPRPRERDPLHHREQARPRPEGGAEHHAEVLLLLRDLRTRMKTVRLFSRFVWGSARARAPRQPALLEPGSASLARAHRLGPPRVRRPGPGRPRRHGHARPGQLGLLHRQLHVPRGRRRGGRRPRHPGLRLRLEADPPARRLRRAPRGERDRHVPPLRPRRHRPARPLLAPAPALRAPELPAVASWPGTSSS